MTNHQSLSADACVSAETTGRALSDDREQLPRAMTAQFKITPSLRYRIAQQMAMDRNGEPRQFKAHDLALRLDAPEADVQRELRLMTQHRLLVSWQAADGSRAYSRPVAAKETDVQHHDGSFTRRVSGTLEIEGIGQVWPVSCWIIGGVPSGFRVERELREWRDDD